MVDFISNTTDVRELARSVLPSDFPDAEIIEEQKAAYIYIAIYTHKFDWSASDPEFPAIAKLEAQLAKAYILEHYGGLEYQNIIDSIKASVDAMLQIIKDNMPTITADEDNVLTVTEPKSWVLNPDAPFISKLEQSLRGDSSMEDDNF